MKKIVRVFIASVFVLVGFIVQTIQAQNPNIIVILADDMGYGDIQAYNQESNIPTPNLNTLCEEGLVFTDAHTNSSVCTPTRYGVLTGRYAWRTRLKRGVLSGYSNHLIDTSRATIASVVKRKDYNTAVIGKWHLGADFAWKNGSCPKEADGLLYVAENNEVDYSLPVKNGPNQLGFDYSFIISGSLDMGPYVYLENGLATAIPDHMFPASNFPAYLRKGEIASDFKHREVLDEFTQKAVSYIDEQAKTKKPFLLYFALTGPHKPALPAKRFIGKSGLEAYGDMVVQVDWTVGEINQALKKNGIEENTLVIFTSDNGSYMYKIGEDQPDCFVDQMVEGYHASNHRANYIWRGTKTDIYEGGHRVPFVVKWPEVVKDGNTSDKTICLTDIFASIAEITNANVSSEMGPDSYSFAKVLSGKEDIKRPSIVHHSVNGVFAVRQGKWKMIFSNGSGGREKPSGKPFGKPYMLYDMENDPQEASNVIRANPEVAKNIEEYLNQVMIDQD
ncbi:sulfatase family protein [Labilibaculum antarcticum]|nr:arylsulfatase [Labilibaculum antarcticum]